MSDAEDELARMFSAEDSLTSLMITMLNEIDLCCSESSDYLTPMTYGLMELWQRVGREDDRIASIRRLTELYGQFMLSMWQARGMLSGYAKNDIWYHAQNLRSSVIELTLALQEDMSVASA